MLDFGYGSVRIPWAFARELVHPDRGPMSLDTLVQMYAWHGRHHVAHLGIVAGSRS